MEINFRFAVSGEQIVDAEPVRFRKEQFPQGFRCVGCGEPMIPRTDGSKKRPHFAHKGDTTCNGETYLHQLAKRQFIALFKELLSANQPLNLELWHPTNCPGIPNPFFAGCPLQRLRDEERQESRIVALDLTQNYRLSGQEQTVDGFVADILLQHTTKKDDTILIEFAVTHESSLAKQTSGLRIIEFKITNEDSMNRFLQSPIRANYPSPWSSEQLVTDGVKIIGFRPRRMPTTPEICGCLRTEYRLFIRYKSGKAFMTSGMFPQVAATFDAKRHAVENWLLYFPSTQRQRFSYIVKPNYLETLEDTFSRAVWDMKKSAIAIKNCVICRHRGKDKYRGRKLYCFARRRAFDSNNEGANCNDFEWKRQGGGDAVS